MTETNTVRALNRVLTDPWGEQKDIVNAESRAYLMAEYLRRITLWANVLGVERNPVDGWPFFDVTDHTGSKVQLVPGVIARLDEVRTAIFGQNVHTLVLAALHWAALIDTGARPMPDLPDPYEPMLLLFERGGGFTMENGMADVGASLVPLRDLKFWDAKDAADLSPEILDALDERLRAIYEP